MKRIFYVDVIRAYAIFLVVFSHAFAPICWAMDDYPKAVWWVFNLGDSVIRVCVPLFIMISGKLLLGSHRDEPYLRFIGRRFTKVVPPFFSWYLIYRFADSVLNDAPFSLGQSLRDFFLGANSYHFYFMYILLGLYLAAPFLRRFVKAVERSELRLLLILWFGYLSLQFLFPEGWGSSGPAAMWVGYGGYYVLGYYLDQETSFSRKKKELLLVCVAIIVINAIATYRLTVAAEGELNERFYVGLAPLVAIYTACVFLVLKDLDYTRWLSAAQRRWTTSLSLDSYNVYLMHMLWIWIFTKGTLGFVLSEQTGGSPLIGVPLVTAAVFAASLGLSRLLRRIPILSRWLVLGAT